MKYSPLKITDRQFDNFVTGGIVRCHYDNLRCHLWRQSCQNWRPFVFSDDTIVTTVPIDPLIAKFMGPTWGPSGADRTQVGSMLAPWTLLSGLVSGANTSVTIMMTHVGCPPCFRGPQRNVNVVILYQTTGNACWSLTSYPCHAPVGLYFRSYNDVIMSTIASQITCLPIVCSTVYSGADQRKHQSSASLAFVRGIHRDRWIPRTNGP